MKIAKPAGRSRGIPDLPAEFETGLLDFDLGAGGFDLLLDLSGFFLGDALFKGLGCAFDEGFSLGETESGHSGANFFNNGDLVGAGIGEDDVEGGFFLSWCSGGSTGWACSGYSNGSSGANAPFFFELFDEVSNFKDGESAELIDECGCICHMVYLCFGIVVSRGIGKFESGSRLTDKEPVVFSCCPSPRLSAQR